MQAWESLLPSQFSTIRDREEAIESGDDFIILVRLGEDGWSWLERLVVTFGESTRFKYTSTIDVIRVTECEAPLDTGRSFELNDLGPLLRLEEKGYAGLHGNYRYIEFGRNGKSRRIVTDKVFGAGKELVSEFEVNFSSIETRLMKNMLMYCSEYEVTETPLPTSSPKN